MKSVFTLNTHVEHALKAGRYDTTKLVNAVQASLNSATRTESGAVKRGNVKLISKEAEFAFTETNTDKYLGKTDAPARFARWHDAQARLFKVCGEPSGEITADVIPAGLRTWLNDKFSLDKAPAPAKGRRNGSVEKVSAPAVPA